MSLLLAIVIGAVLGASVGWLFRRSVDYLLIDVIVGLAGALLGTAFYYFIHVGQASYWAWGGAISAALGAGILMFVYQGVLLIPKHKHAHAEGTKAETEAEEEKDSE